MPLLEDLTKQNLKQFGIQGLSFTMPATTQKWADESSDTPAITFTLNTLSLSYTANNWLAPFGGLITEVNTGSKKIKFSLQKADGSMLNEAGALLRLFPQQVLRLKRLLALKTEDAGTHNPQRANGIPVRQVPAFVFIASSGSITEGLIRAGEDTGINGAMSFFDEQGYIIHPLYIASLVKSLTGLYPALDIDGDNTLSNQMAHIVGLQADSNLVRLVKPDGTPATNAHLEGINDTDAGTGSSVGLFSINSYSGSDTELKGEITRAAATAADGAFPPRQAQQLLMGNISYGRLLNKAALPKLPAALAANTFNHDFFTIKVVELEKYLLGVAPDDFNGTKLEPKPQVRLNEQLSVLTNGNSIMGRLSTIFTGTATEALCVGTAIDTTLPLPADAVNIQWPQFPALPGTVTAEPDTVALPADLKDQLKVNSRADFIQPAGGVQPTDILLTLTGLPRGCAVRVFNREFLADAVIQRGNGAGGACFTEVPPFTGRTLNGQAILVLKDPLGLKRPDGTITVPTEPKLIIDVMIVRQNPTQKRLMGAIVIPVQTPAVAAPAALPANAINAAGKKGVSNAAILGLQLTNTTTIDFTSFNAALNTILSLTGETQPRDASRHPTMARRDMLAAALKAGNWESVISGGQINGNLHNAQQDMGCPGSPGGAETANVGIYTQNARLAYDIARMSFRRTTSFYDRILQLANANWNEPAANTALAENAASTANTGTFAGAVLQTISPYCETPELALLKSLAESNINAIPATFDDLVNTVNGWINGISTSGFPSLLQTAADRLRTTLVTALNNLKDNNDLNESDKERLYNELKREVSAACFGRRDTQWALLQAIKQARHSLYIETPGFSFTKSGSAASYAVDLIQELNTQLQAKPGLKVILCVPKKPDYQRQYEQWISSEVKERYTILQGLPGEQVVAFHPVGFPGRPSHIEQTVVIADDQWAITGSSAFRRRGLTFDGGSDFVFTDFDTVNGSAVGIKNLRKNLLKQRLGIDPADDTSSRALQIEHISSSFASIRQALVAGGLGKIERLWNGRTDGIAYAEPTIDRELANPEGLEFNTLQALVFSAFATLAK